MQLKNSLVELNPMARFLVLVLLIFICSLFALGILFAVNHLFFNYPFDLVNYLNMNSSSNYVLAAKVLQITSQLGMFLLPAFAFAYLTSSSIKSGLGFGNPIYLKAVGLVVVVTLLSIPFVNVLAEWNASWHLPEFMAGMEDWMRNAQIVNDNLLEVLVQMNTPSDVVINILMMAIIPAVGEELIFRGIIQTELIKGLKNPHIAIVITAILFSAFHMQFLGFFSRVLLGMLFGYLFYWSKNIWMPIIAHFINNALALSLVLIYGTEMDANSTTDSTGWELSVTTLILIVIGSYMLVRNKRWLQEK